MKPQENAKKYLFSYLKNKPIFYNSNIYIYGSYARNKEKYDSDLDVLIVIDKIEQIDILETTRILRYKDNITAPIDIKIITTEKWNTSNSTYINNIKREGINVTEEFRNIL